MPNWVQRANQNIIATRVSTSILAPIRFMACHLSIIALSRNPWEFSHPRQLGLINQKIVEYQGQGSLIDNNNAKEKDTCSRYFEAHLALINHSNVLGWTRAAICHNCKWQIYYAVIKCHCKIGHLDMAICHDIHPFTAETMGIYV